METAGATPHDAAAGRRRARLPRVLASSVIRGAHLGESHGGLYLIDLESGAVEQKLDWSRSDIDFGGRGGDRGLRGIAFLGEQILVAANAEILIFDRRFRLLESHRNPYLAHCHEVAVSGRRAVITSTGFDSLLVFDADARRFSAGWQLGQTGRELLLRRFDPEGRRGPDAGNQFHLNCVTAGPAEVWFSGLNIPALMKSDGKELTFCARLPEGTHNAQLLDGGVVYNDTASDRVCYEAPGERLALAVPVYAGTEILNIDRYASTLARPGFARGLCRLAPGLIAAGSSPSTVSVYDLRAGSRIRQVNVSRDVRNAIHGLAVWPFD